MPEQRAEPDGKEVSEDINNADRNTPESKTMSVVYQANTQQELGKGVFFIELDIKRDFKLVSTLV